jgi:uncharacterized protein (TIGR03437 family)
VPALPAIFRNPDDSAIAMNQDGTLNGAFNPAPIGSNVTIWMTGSVYNFAPGLVNAGLIATFSNNYECCQVELANIFVPVSYAGTAPGSVMGVSQVTFQVPELFTGISGFNGYAIQLQVMDSDGSLSRPVTLQIGGE